MNCQAKISHCFSALLQYDQLYVFIQYVADTNIRESHIIFFKMAPFKDLTKVFSKDIHMLPFSLCLSPHTILYKLSYSRALLYAFFNVHAVLRI